jgi:hypothetical protein
VYVSWEVILVEEVHDWLADLARVDAASAKLVGSAIDQLAIEGPNLGRPLVDTIKGSKLQNLKELRPGSGSRTEIRLLFVFDPQRQAVVLVAGDKVGQWSRWYREHIPIAEQRFEKWLRGGYGEEIL